MHFHDFIVVLWLCSFISTCIALSVWH